MANTSGFDPAAFFIGGGAEHSPEVVRNMLFSATNGAEGVTRPGDWKVTPMAAASGQVRIAPGSGLILNRHIGPTPDETYSARASQESFRDIRQTDASGPRSDLVVVRVEDPQYEGWPDPPSEEAARNWDYTKPFVIENVNPATRRFEELNLGYAGYALARVDMPANTTVVGSGGGTVVDLRKLHTPAQTSKTYRHQPSVAQEIPTDTWGLWPNWEPLFDVPMWATHVTAVMVSTGVYKPTGAHIIGDLSLEFSTPGSAGQVMGTVTFEVEAGTSPSRESVTISGEGDVTAHRGKTRTIRIGARRSSQFSQGAPAQGSQLIADRGSNFVLTVQFEQRAV